MIPQFSGETRRDAIVNHYSLDVEGEKSFIDFIYEMGYSITDDDEMIESLHEMWTQQ